MYVYDFGDSWTHIIELEKVLDRDQNVVYPTCTGGKRACPPEDCGGIWRYGELLHALANHDPEEFDEMLEWLGSEFDPEEFDKEEVNEMLNTEDYGAFTMW